MNRFFSTTCALLMLIGCESGRSGSKGDLSVLLESEETIAEGLAAGSGPEDILDGWSAGFDKYIVAIGNIDIHRSTNETIEAEDANVIVVDLKKLSSGGRPLWSFRNLDAGRWEFFYETPNAPSDAVQDESVSSDDFDDFVSNQLTYRIEGSIEKSDGISCPPSTLSTDTVAAPNGILNARGDDCYDNPSIHFTWPIQIATVFGPCEVDETPGFSVPSGGSQTVAITLHGDHLFFNGFASGAEGSITRLAQWLADCDLDVDGEVTPDELQAITPADLAEIDSRYELGASPIELNSMWDYVAAQLKTQGHFQGEGECPVDGVAHDH
ncbi:MAG: hypothetical protein R3A47_03470 [Polyangiales bacterium]